MCVGATQRLICVVAIVLGLGVGGGGGCAPLIRVGDIEPPEGERVVIDLEVAAEQEEASERRRLIAALGDASVASLVMVERPVVPGKKARLEMATSVQSGDTPAEEALVSESKLTSDARRLESIYMAQGYFQAQSRGYELMEREEDRAAVRFTIKEGGPTRVVELRLLGACEEEGEGFDREASVRKQRLCEAAARELPLQVGEIWTEAAYAAGLDRLVRQFRAAGFLHARVIGDNWVSPERAQAAVWYEIDAGPLVRASGPAEVEGNQRVSTERIMRRVRLKAGAIIDETLLRGTEWAVRGLGPFYSVAAVAEAAEGDAARPARMGVKVKVAEAPLWELTVGPSISTDFTGLEFGLPIGFTHRDILSDVIALRASAKPALVFPDCFTGDAACFDAPKFGIDSKLRLEVPSFFEEYLGFAVDANYKRDPSQEVQVEEIGGSIGISRPLARGVQVRFGYNLAFYNYFASTALSSLTPTDEAALMSQAALRFKEQDLLAWYDLALVVDQRDAPLNARDGYYIALSANFAGAYSGSEVPFIRLRGDLRGYWTPTPLPWLTLAARIHAGGNIYDDARGTPQPARFRSGGAGSMRGFATDRLGDYICAVPGPNGEYLNNPECGRNASERTYIGGNYLLESNFEIRIQMPGGLGFVAFADIGRVWSTSGFSVDDLYYAVGPGLRYDLPIGPIRFDLGFLLGDQPATELHFSLGQAF